MGRKRRDISPDDIRAWLAAPDRRAAAAAMGVGFSTMGKAAARLRRAGGVRRPHRSGGGGTDAAARDELRDLRMENAVLRAMLALAAARGFDLLAPKDED